MPQDIAMYHDNQKLFLGGPIINSYTQLYIRGVDFNQEVVQEEHTCQRDDSNIITSTEITTSTTSNGIEYLM